MSLVWNGRRYVRVPEPHDDFGSGSSRRRKRGVEDSRWTPPPPDPRNLDSKNPPPYGKKVVLCESTSGLPTALVGNVPQERIYKMYATDPERCFVYFREEGYLIPFGKLRLA